MNAAKNSLGHGISSGLIFVLAFACGSIAANLYYAQTLVVLIAESLHLSLKLSGFLVTLTQIGYVIGLLFIVPLADIIENKQLILSLLGLLCILLLSIGFAHTSLVFLLCCFFIGLTTVSVQIILPLVAHLTPIEMRGKAVGNVVSGLLSGIMLARPMASWITDTFATWRAIFIFSIILMFIVATLLYYLLPTRFPETAINYKQLISSLPTIIKSYPVLRRRAIYQAILFGIFSLFWTAVAILLTELYHYSQTQVALFAFVGAGGALVAPIAGRIADRGFTRIATGISIIIVAIACLLAKPHMEYSIIILVIAALLLDAGVSCSLVLGQRAIYALDAEVRSRLNGLYMATFFTGGAIGSGLSGYLYVIGGWDYITNAGFIASLIAFIYFLSEYFVKTIKL